MVTDDKTERETAKPSTPNCRPAPSPCQRRATVAEPPSRIWIDRGPKGGWMFRDRRMPDSEHEYVRADLLAAKDAEIVRLIAAVEEQFKRTKLLDEVLAENATLTAARDRWAAEAVRLKAEAAEARRKGIEFITAKVATWRNDIPMTGEECANAIRALLAEENGDG